MTILNLTDLPDILKPIQPGIENSLKPYIAITAEPARHLNLWQSKFGGLPYFPKEQTYPADAAGQPLVLLAQLNFAEVFANNPLVDNFPDHGILQFYIAADDDLYGADFDHPLQQDKFRVMYFEQIIETEDQLLNDFSFLPQQEDRLTPLTGQYALQFEQKIAPVALNDFSFPQFMQRDAYGDDDNADAFYETYSEHFGSTGHKLGGYPFFTQSDPREYDQTIKDYILLFQMDSDYDYPKGDNAKDIMWGDVGVANFFILPEDLKNRDFSRVLYNWDCG